MTIKSIIKTKDNNKKNPYHLKEAERDVHLTNLQKLSGKNIKDINLHDHPDLLIFPRDFETYGDKIGDEKIFELSGDNLITGNILGFIGYKGTQVFIRSRFDNDDGKDYFLNYMLQKVFGLNVLNLDTHSDNNEGLDFLIYLFPGMLKDALRQGIYREYQVRHYNNLNVKGRMDIARHIRRNFPFTGNMAYDMREHVADNHVMQLIRHTIEYIRQLPMGENILCNDDTTKEYVNIINECTPTYNRQNRQSVINQNIRPFSHPYYQAYLSLQRLCIRILRHEELKHGSNNDQIHGVLFDGAWLWEEYLNTFLRTLLKHPRNNTKEGRLWLFNDNSGECFPDFYNKNLILDAKYKGYTSWPDVQNADIFQIISYMHILDVKKGGYLIPVTASIQTKILKGNIPFKMKLFGLDVGIKRRCFKDYCEYMASQEDSLIDRILNFTDN